MLALAKKQLFYFFSVGRSFGQKINVLFARWLNLVQMLMICTIFRITGNVCAYGK
jgi:hypothetical protein